MKWLNTFHALTTCVHFVVAITLPHPPAQPDATDALEHAAVEPWPVDVPAAPVSWSATMPRQLDDAGQHNLSSQWHGQNAPPAVQAFTAQAGEPTTIAPTLVKGDVPAQQEDRP